MHKYREGSALAEGPDLERIRRDGVVLDYHGLRFVLPRQQSILRIPRTSGRAIIDQKDFTLTMSGLVTVLPLALTVYVIWWLVNTVEGWLRRALIGAEASSSPEHYWPGLGLDRRIFPAADRRQPGQRLCRQDILLKYWDDFLGRIPFVKTLYGGFRDVVSLLPSGSGEKRDLQRVVLARFADVHAIGFVTREDVPAVLRRTAGTIGLPCISP